MVSQATKVTNDLRSLLYALLEDEPDKAWAHSKLLTENIECRPDYLPGLPSRLQVMALLGEVLGAELTRTMQQAPPKTEH